MLPSKISEQFVHKAEEILLLLALEHCSIWGLHLHHSVMLLVALLLHHRFVGTWIFILHYFQKREIFFVAIYFELVSNFAHSIICHSIYYLPFGAFYIEPFVPSAWVSFVRTTWLSNSRVS